MMLFKRKDKVIVLKEDYKIQTKDAIGLVPMYIFTLSIKMIMCIDMHGWCYL